MKLNEDVILKIYHEFLNTDLETKSRLRHACPFIYRHYYDTRFVEINSDIIILYYKFLLSKSKKTNTSSTPPPPPSIESLLHDQHHFINFQKTFPVFQNLRIRNMEVSGLVEDFFEVILKVFKEQPTILHELSNYIQNSNNTHLPNNKTKINSDPPHEIPSELPFRLLYDNNNSQKAILKPILKLALEQGLQQNTTISFEDFTYQQRMALEGLFEAFYNLIQVKICQHLHFIPNFMHLRNFELYNCRFNYTLAIPYSPYLTSIKAIDSKIKLMIDSHQCPRLKSLILDEETSLKLTGKNFDQLERVQLRNINIYGTPQFPQFNHLKSFRLNNYPSTNVTLPTMNDLQELFVQSSQLCEHIYIKPQPNLKFLRLWNYHSCLSLVDEDIQYIYSNYCTVNGSNASSINVDYHRLSALSTSSTSTTISSSSTASTISSILSSTESFIDYPTYFPKVEYLRIGYCSDLLFIKQISQRISTMTVKFSSSNSSPIYNSISEKKRLRRFNLLFPNLKTLVIERSCDDIINYLKWFIPTLPLLTNLIFKDCHWSGQGVTTAGVVEPSSTYQSTTTVSTDPPPQQLYSNDTKKSEGEEKEEEEQDKIEELLLRSNNLETVLKKMRFPSSLIKIIFINCSKELTEFIPKILKKRRLSIQFDDIQCSEYELKKWWVMF